MALISMIAIPAEAQSARRLGTLSQTRRTLLSVMGRAGCPELWLSRVMTDNDITTDELHRLPVGQRVLARGNTCRGVPPASVQQTSLAIMRNESNREMLVTLQATEKRLLSEVSILSGKNKELETRVSTLAEERRKVEEARDRAQAAATDHVSGSNLWLAGVAGAALGIALTFLLSFILEQKMVKLPRETLEIRDKEGVVHTCQRNGIVESPPGSGHLVGNYPCPLGCKAPRLYGDILLEHVNDKCTERKTTMVQGPANVVAKLRTV